MIDEIIDRIIDWILNLLGISKEQKNKKVEIRYIKRNFMTQSEIFFYNKIKELENEYKIVPQLNLGTVIEKQNKGYRNELFKNIDFAVFSSDYKEILLLIELNDSTHKQYKRRKRDEKVRKICKTANIKLITFYTSYPNKKEYVLNRIREEIENNKLL